MTQNTKPTSIKNIMADLGISPATFHRHRKKLGITTQKIKGIAHLTPEQVEQVTRSVKGYETSDTTVRQVPPDKGARGFSGETDETNPTQKLNESQTEKGFEAIETSEINPVEIVAEDDPRFLKGRIAQLESELEQAREREAKTAYILGQAQEKNKNLLAYQEAHPIPQTFTDRLKMLFGLPNPKPQAQIENQAESANEPEETEQKK